MQLTIEELNNLIVFGNRADIKGGEADTWVALKQKLAAEGQRLVAENVAFVDKQKALAAVPRGQ